MNGNKLDIMRRHNTNGNIIKGRDFPRHLQVAYGRYIARLVHGVSVSGGGLWLRDLPQNLDQLRDEGWPAAISAYLGEVSRLFYAGRISADNAADGPFGTDWLAFELAELEKPI